MMMRRMMSRDDEGGAWGEEEEEEADDGGFEDEDEDAYYYLIASRIPAGPRILGSLIPRCLAGLTVSVLASRLLEATRLRGEEAKSKSLRREEAKRPRG